MGNKEGTKSKKNYWKSEFSKSQLTHLFDVLGRKENTIAGSESKVFQQSTNAIRNKKLPAGYTYLGQFLAHEMTFNINTLSDIKSPLVGNFRTPRLDLDSVYGKGPLVEPLYYDHNRCRGRVYLSLQERDDSRKKTLDFTRIIQGKNNEIAVPVIPDVRNDENILVAHIHLSIMRFHNKMADEIIENIIDEIKNARMLEDSTKVNLSNQVFVDFLVENQPLGKNYEGEQILWQFLEVLIKSEVNKDEGIKEALPHTSFHAVDSSEKETALASSDLKAQIQALSTDLAKSFLALPAFYLQEGNGDPEKEIQRAQSKLNTILDEIFILAKRETIWHFQWLILTDFLPKIVGKEMMNSILSNFPEFKNSSSVPIERVCLYKYKKLNCEPFEKLPPIFTGAFFRFGHYLVLDSYQFNFVDKSKSTEGNVITLKKSLTPINFNVKLSGFFGGNAENGSSFNMLVNRIMTEKVSNSTQNHNNNIVVRNLRQTAKMSLPSGQYFAQKEIGDKDLEILTSNSEAIMKELKDGNDSDMLKILAESFPKNLRWKNNNLNFTFNDFLDHSPPWFYMALEAYILAEGKHLGPVAGRVVAEVIIKLLESDPTSILGEGNLASRPIKVIEEEKKAGVPYSYTMADFLKFTNTYDFKKEEESEEPNKESQ